jgi:hypothetical protein
MMPQLQRGQFTLRRCCSFAPAGAAAADHAQAGQQHRAEAGSGTGAIAKISIAFTFTVWPRRLRSMMLMPSLSGLP